MRISDWSSDVCSSDLGDTNGDGIFQDPAYIPLVNDPIVNYGSATPGQIAAFHEFIENNSYLAARRGSIAERNGDRYSWVNQHEVSFQQELTGLLKGHKSVIPNRKGVVLGTDVVVQLDVGGGRNH